VKFFIINSFRTMVYVAFFAIIGYGIYTGLFNNGQISANLLSQFGLGVDPGFGQVLDVIIGGFAGWVVASVICGLIVTLLDIRDDINDRLPDARRDD